jgi:hypothetical protein
MGAGESKPDLTKSFKCHHCATECAIPEVHVCVCVCVCVHVCACVCVCVCFVDIAMGVEVWWVSG